MYTTGGVPDLCNKARSTLRGGARNRRRVDEDGRPASAPFGGECGDGDCWGMSRSLRILIEATTEPAAGAGEIWNVGRV